MTNSAKHSSLLRYRISYSCKLGTAVKNNITGPRWEINWVGIFFFNRNQVLNRTERRASVGGNSSARSMLNKVTKIWVNLRFCLYKHCLILFGKVVSCTSVFRDYDLIEVLIVWAFKCSKQLLFWKKNIWEKLMICESIWMVTTPQVFVLKKGWRQILQNLFSP